MWQFIIMLVITLLISMPISNQLLQGVEPRFKTKGMLLMTALVSSFFGWSIAMAVMAGMEGLWWGVVEFGLDATIFGLIIWQRLATVRFMKFFDESMAHMHAVNNAVLDRLTLFSWLERFGTRQLAYLKSVHSQDGVKWKVEAQGFGGNHVEGNTILETLAAAKVIDDMVEEARL